jgi:hypothetical protein
VPLTRHETHDIPSQGCSQKALATLATVLLPLSRHVARRKKSKLAGELRHFAFRRLPLAALSAHIARWSVSAALVQAKPQSICLPAEVMDARRRVTKHLAEGIHC